MGWKLEEQADGTWDWEFWLSSHGWAGGTAATREAAIVELLIGEAAVLESPYAPSVKQMMRDDPARVAADFDGVS
jgi:hypothetical protein